MTADADVVVVGGGIAGWCAAFHAARKGRRVVVVDALRHRASDVPVALINPLRGPDGRLVPRGVAGMHATFALIDRLRADGHRIEHARGLFRPLVGARAGARDRGYWAARLGDQLRHDWYDEAPATLGLVDRVATLHLPDAGWVASAALLQALRQASGAIECNDEVASIGTGSVTFADGHRIAARAVVWCGGAWGAARFDAARDGLYKPGCLVRTAARPTGAPLTFGSYAAPCDAGTWFGPTREAASPTFPDDAPEPGATDPLAERFAQLFGANLSVDAVWRGVRLARSPAALTAALAGAPSITALGSRGYLLAPLLASEWAGSL